MEQKIVVVSLFDGLSGGRIALERAEIRVLRYYSSEIEEQSIKVANDNYPQDQKYRLGDITKVDGKKILKEIRRDFGGDVDILLIGGSPCQGFSLAGQKKGSTTTCDIEVTSLDQYLKLKEDGFEFHGESFLFWEFMRIKQELEPDYFMVENVKMAKKWLDMFSNALGVKPKLINSNLVSFQNRERYYWTNIPFEDILDKQIFLKDNYSKLYDDSLVLKGKGLNKLDRDRSRVTDVKSDKCPTLMASQYKKPTDAIVFKHGDIYRYPTREEMEAMQTLPIGYTKKVKYNDAAKMIGNGWTIDIVAQIFRGLNG